MDIEDRKWRTGGDLQRALQFLKKNEDQRLPI